MKIENEAFDIERAFYGAKDLTLSHCTFDGPADGESALKECRGLKTEACHFNLRYPFWHDRRVEILNSDMTPLCRAALWYSHDIIIRDSRLHGIKALRECSNIVMTHCHTVSTEFGWFCRELSAHDSYFEGEYFMLHSRDLSFSEIELQGKYSFQYVKNCRVENAKLYTKDAFWHAENVVVSHSVVKGEYLGWYAKNITFDHCRIIGTQPLCYTENVTLIDCEMMDCDLSFEKSSVEATLTSPILSIKNPLSGSIYVPAVGEVIMDEPWAEGKVVIVK